MRCKLKQKTDKSVAAKGQGTLLTFQLGLHIYLHITNEVIMKLRFLLFVLLFSFTRTLFAQDLRGDTIDLHSYLITLDMSNYASGSLTGDARIGVIAKMNNVQGIHLDLIQLKLDSVKVNAVNSGYTYNDTLLNIDFQTTLNQGDSATVEVYYHGRPLQIAGDFGGFYWLSSAAYNIGVSFKSDPNNFGKCWFPCFDNFQVRSNYEYYVSTPNTDKAFCNGLLLDSTVNQFKTTWHWKLKESIPSYLASTTVSHFLTITDTVNGINGTIPIEIGVTPADTVQLRKQFIHLHQAFHNLEAHWGPYPWERIGYTIVPFNAGAMEHATNITFSSYFLDPGIPSFYNQGEQKMAHELSHHWFGDLVTTDGSPDMWLNEGWAVFNEYLFFEGVYSPDSAKLQWRLNHQWVQWMAAIADSAYLPVSGVPHSKTYGTTVYQKGGDMVHTLRGYMGDSLFFSCIRGYLNYYRYNNGGTQLMSNYLSQCSGMDLSDFFNDWILAPDSRIFQSKTAV
jgi:aminopeptidase N